MDQRTHSRHALGVFLTLTGGICWGFSGACGQYLFSHYSIGSDYLTCIRMLISGSILTILCLLHRRHEMAALLKRPRDLLQLLLFTVFGLSMSQYTYLTTISYSNAGTATVLQYTGPILLLLVECVRHRRRPSRLELLTVVLAIVGTFFLATHGRFGSLALSREALFWGALSAVSLTFYSTLAVSITRKYGSEVVMCFSLLLGGIGFSLLPGTLQHGAALGFDGILALMGIVLVGTVYAYTAYIQGVSLVGSVKGSLLSSVEPVSATLFAVAWLGTAFQPIDIVGFACILSTVFLLSMRKTNE